MKRRKRTKGRFKGLLDKPAPQLACGKEVEKGRDAADYDPAGPTFKIRVLSFGPESCTESCILDQEYILESLSEQSVTWIDTDGLSDVDAIHKLGNLFGFHRLAIEDVINCHQRAKLEQYGDHYFLVLRMMRYDDVLHTEQFSIFLGKNYCVTFQEHPDGDCLDSVRDRIRHDRGRVRKQGSDYLFYCLLDAVIDSYFPILERYGEVMDNLEDEIIVNHHKNTISKIHDIKRDLLLLRRTVWPLREVCNTLLRDENPLISDDTRIYLRDCYDHVVRVIDLVENYRELAADLMDLCLSIVSNKMNEVMKVLTIISTIFIPLTFIVGVYGMNFDTDASPLNMPELKSPYGYPVVMLIMAAIVVVMLIFFRRKKWLGGD